MIGDMSVHFQQEFSKYVLSFTCSWTVKKCKETNFLAVYQSIWPSHTSFLTSCQKWAIWPVFDTYLMDYLSTCINNLMKKRDKWLAGNFHCMLVDCTYCQVTHWSMICHKGLNPVRAWWRLRIKTPVGWHATTYSTNSFFCQPPITS